jgi:ribose-phosphate pyrophosphokinase
MGNQSSQLAINNFEINLAIDGNLPSLSSLGIEDLKLKETELNEQLVQIGDAIRNGAISAVSIGRGRFFVLDKNEAIAIQSEREESSKIIDKQKSNLDPKLKSEFLLFSSLGSQELASKVANQLGIKLGTLNFEQFKDGELSLSIKENVRDRETFLILPTSKPINEQLIELFISIDALKRASAKKITVLMPYFGYARQDKQLKGREPISSKLIAKLLKEAGADRIVTLDLHSDQSVGFFDISIENLRASSVLIPHLKNKFNPEDLVVVSPDEGGIKRASKYAEKLGSNLAVIHKQRKGANKIKEMIVLGDVEGKDCLIVDDMIDTGGTLMKAAEKLKQAGAKRIFACCIHAVLSADAVDKLRSSQIEQLICTDTIPLSRAKTDKIEVVSVAPLLAEGIKRLMTKGSIRELEQTYL